MVVHLILLVAFVVMFFFNWDNAQKGGGVISAIGCALCIAGFLNSLIKIIVFPVVV